MQPESTLGILVTIVLTFVFFGAIVCWLYSLFQFVRNMVIAHRNVLPGFEPWHELPLYKVLLLGPMWVLSTNQSLNEAGKHARLQALHWMKIWGLAAAALATIIALNEWGVI